MEGKGEDFYFYPDVVENIAGYQCRGGMGVEGFEGVPLVACEPGRITASRLLLTAERGAPAKKTEHWARSCNGPVAELQMGKILGRPELGR